MATDSHFDVLIPCQWSNYRFYTENKRVNHMKLITIRLALDLRNCAPFKACEQTRLVSLSILLQHHNVACKNRYK